LKERSVMIPIVDEQDTEVVRYQVAEKLGWRTIEYGASGLLIGLPPGQKKPSAVPSYARDIKAAWEIVECLVCRHIKIDIRNELINRYVRYYRAVIGEPASPLGNGCSRKAAMAICMAFLEVPKDVLNRADGKTIRSGDIV